jgi:hypothetical protein
MVFLSCQERQSVTPDTKTDTVMLTPLSLLNDSCECQPGHGGENWLLLSNFALNDYNDDFFIFMPDSELRILRNSIYASKGLIFKSNDLIEHFSSESWYCPKYANVDSLLTIPEKANIDFIKSFEGRRYPDTLDRHQYFLDLFTGAGQTIPFYYRKYYLDFDMDGYSCRADRLIKHTDKYDVVIYFSHLVPIPAHQDYDMTIVTIDKRGRILSSQKIFENYHIENGNELTSTENIWDYTQDELIEPVEKIKYHYMIRPNGAIIRKEI